MIKIEIKDHIISISDLENEAIFAWNHKTFFTLAVGYKFDEKKKCYVYSERSKLRKILRETVAYLIDNKLEFEQDENVTKIMVLSQRSQLEYEQAIVAGLQAKNTSTTHNISSAGLTRQLKDYQEKALNHLLSVKHGANFSVPGSGKTTVVYAAFNVLRRQGIAYKLFIIGPRSCFQPWEEESFLCFGDYLRSARLVGSKTKRLSLYLQANEYDSFLSTYQTTVNDLEEIIDLLRREKVFLVIDESHNIKRLEGGIWADAILGIAPYATRRAILSGTPAPNSYTDLWTQITFLWPEEQVLGDRYSYRSRNDLESDINSIREAIRPFFFRTSKSELKLPPVEYDIITCDMKQYQASIYHSLSVRLLKDLDIQIDDRIELRKWRKAKMVRLIQAASNPALLTEYSEEFDIPQYRGEVVSIIELINKYPRYEIPTKIEYTINLISDLLKNNEKVVVWSSFIHNIKMLQRLLTDVKPYVVYGAVPKDLSEDEEFNREQQIHDFKTLNRPTVLLANPAACAESISLHKICHHAIYLDRTFNCGQYMQSLDRLHRIGLEANEIVTYHILISKNTIDETIQRRLEEKEEAMIRLIEDELPVVSFETEEFQMGASTEEELVDFEETIKDLKITIKA